MSRALQAPARPAVPPFPATAPVPPLPPFPVVPAPPVVPALPVFPALPVAPPLPAPPPCRRCWRRHLRYYSKHRRFRPRRSDRCRSASRRCRSASRRSRRSKLRRPNMRRLSRPEATRTRIRWWSSEGVSWSRTERGHKRIVATRLRRGRQRRMSNTWFSRLRRAVLRVGRDSLVAFDRRRFETCQLRLFNSSCLMLSVELSGW